MQSAARAYAKRCLKEGRLDARSYKKRRRSAEKEGARVYIRTNFSPDMCVIVMYNGEFKSAASRGKEDNAHLDIYYNEDIIVGPVKYIRIYIGTVTRGGCVKRR